MPPERFTTDRQYLHVQPSTDPLQPTDVARSMTRLHRTTNGTPTPQMVPLMCLVRTARTWPPADTALRRPDWLTSTPSNTPATPASTKLVPT